MSGVIAMPCLVALVAMPPVSTVHVKMQQWAKEQQRIGQQAKEMRRVLCDQKERSIGEKGEQDYACL